MLDSYDIFAINLITTFLGLVFWQGPPELAANGYGGNYGSLPTPVSQALKASTSAGIVVGQIVFGWLADVFGRRRMYGVELGIIVIATFGCSLVGPSQAVSFTGIMTFWRVMMVSGTDTKDTGRPSCDAAGGNVAAHALPPRRKGWQPLISKLTACPGRRNRR